MLTVNEKGFTTEREMILRIVSGSTSALFLLGIILTYVIDDQKRSYSYQQMHLAATLGGFAVALWLLFYSGKFRLSISAKTGEYTLERGILFMSWKSVGKLTNHSRFVIEGDINKSRRCSLYLKIDDRPSKIFYICGYSDYELAHEDLYRYSELLKIKGYGAINYIKSLPDSKRNLLRPGMGYTDNLLHPMNSPEYDRDKKES